MANVTAKATADALIQLALSAMTVVRHRSRNWSHDADRR
jgi:hypothetical protein